MPTCQNCFRTLKWKHTGVHFFWIHSSINCPFCGATQYPAARERKIDIGMSQLILVLIFIYYIATGNSAVTIGLFSVALLAYAAFHPLLLKLSNQKEKLF